MYHSMMGGSGSGWFWMVFVTVAFVAVFVAAVYIGVKVANRKPTDSTP